MFESIIKFFRKSEKKENKTNNSKEAAKERLHLVLMQDRANVSADFLELMKQEIIEVIKKYIDVDESAIDVRLTNKENDDGTNGAPALYANIPIINIKNETRKIEHSKDKEETKAEKKLENTEKTEVKKEEKVEEVIEEAKIIIDEENSENKEKQEEATNKKETKENKKEKKTEEKIKSEK